MKKILVVLAVMALPQVVGLSTVCSAGGRTSCYSDPTTGACDYVISAPCGSYSSGNHCVTSPNPAYIPTAAAKKAPPAAITPYICECK